MSSCFFSIKGIKKQEEVLVFETKRGGGIIQKPGMRMVTMFLM